MNNRIALGSNLGKSIGNGTTNRYFTTLDGTADYYTIPTVTLGNTFTFECEFSLASLTGDQAIISNSALNEYVRIDATNGGVDMQLKGQFRSNSGKFVSDARIHNLKLISTDITVNQKVEIYYDDVLIDTYLFNVIGNTVWDGIGVRRSGLTNYFNGVISEVKITDGTDLIRYYKLDEDLSATSTIIDSGSDGSNGTAISISSSELFVLEGADWIGAELVVNGSFSTDSDWTKTAGVTISGGSANSVAVASNNLSQNIGSIENLIYKVDYTILNYVSGSLKSLVGGGSSATARSANGSYSENIKSVSGATFDQIFLQAPSAYTGSIDNVSVKRILEAP